MNTPVIASETVEGIIASAGLDLGVVSRTEARPLRFDAATADAMVAGQALEEAIGEHDTAGDTLETMRLAYETAASSAAEWALAVGLRLGAAMQAGITHPADLAAIADEVTATLDASHLAQAFAAMEHRTDLT